MENRTPSKPLETIEMTIEDIVAKMRKAGKSFSWIASALLLSEGEVKAAFKRYQERLEKSDRSGSER